MVEQHTLWTKIKSNGVKFLIGVLLGSLFYSYIFIPKHSTDYYAAEKSFLKAKGGNTIALNEVKKSVFNKPVYEKYKVARAKKQEAFNKLNFEIEREKTFVFPSFHFFWERFGGNTTDFIFGIFVLFMFFTNTKPKEWSYLFTGFYLSTKIFTYIWIFSRLDDFSRFTYYLMTIVSAAVIVYAVYLFTKYRKTRIQKLEAQKAQLQKQKKEIAKFAYINIPDEMNDEMIEVLDKNM